MTDPTPAIAPDLLVCPRTRRPLVERDGRLESEDGRHRYAVVDGVPVLLTDEERARYVASAGGRVRRESAALPRLPEPRLGTGAAREAGRELRAAAREAAAGGGLAFALGGAAGFDPPGMPRFDREPYAAVDVVAEAAELPLATAAAQVALVCSVLATAGSAEATAAEIARVLAPGGRLLSVVEGPAAGEAAGERAVLRRLTPEGHRRLWEGAGFEVTAAGPAGRAGAELRELAASGLVARWPGGGGRGRLARAVRRLVRLLLAPLSFAGGEPRASFVLAEREGVAPGFRPGRHGAAAYRRIHVGCGRERLEGWLNVDLLPLPGVDLVADVTRGLEVSNAEAIYAEHFLEHLSWEDAIGFLLEAHRALAPGGWLRLSTPNLDWHHLAYDYAGPGPDRAFQMNLGFYAWGHRFLWNRELLGEALAATGFADVRWHRHGESDHPLFAGIERHETYLDTETHPHVLIAEARKGEPRPEALAALRERARREFLGHLE